MASLTIKRMTAMHNVAAILLGEEPVKAFKDSPTAQRRLEEATGKLGVQQHTFFEPKELKAPRPSSVKHVLVTLMDVDEGVDEAVLAEAVGSHYTSKGKENPPTISSLLAGLRMGNGYGFRRIGSRYWLVTP